LYVLQPELMCNVSSNLYVASELIAAFVYKKLRIFILTFWQDIQKKKYKVQNRKGAIFLTRICIVYYVAS